METRIVEAPFLFQVEQFAALLFVQILRLSDLLGQQQNAAVSVKNLSLPVGVFQALAERHRAVILQNDRVRGLQERSDRLSKSLVAWSFVRSDWNFAHEDFNFRQDALRNRLTSNRESRGMRRMTMHNRLNIRTILHDLQMQQHFAGPFANAGDLLAFHVDGTDIFRLHEAFADHCRSTQHFVFANSNADVPIIRSRKAFVVNTTPDLADLFFEGSVVNSAVPFVGHDSSFALR